MSHLALFYLPQNYSIVCSDVSYKKRIPLFELGFCLTRVEYSSTMSKPYPDKKKPSAPIPHLSSPHDYPMETLPLALHYHYRDCHTIRYLKTSTADYKHWIACILLAEILIQEVWGLGNCISKKQSWWVWCKNHRDHTFKSTGYWVKSRLSHHTTTFISYPLSFFSLPNTALHVHSPSLLIFLPPLQASQVLITSPLHVLRMPFPLPPGIPSYFFKIYFQYSLPCAARSQSFSVFWMNKWMKPQPLIKYQLSAKCLNICNHTYFSQTYKNRLFFSLHRGGH